MERRRRPPGSTTQDPSKNWVKARRQVAVAHRKVRHARLDHAHQLPARLIRENQTVAVEQLTVAGPARSGAKGKRGASLRRAVHDAGRGQFLRLLGEKGQEHGRAVVAVNPAYTSQVCGRLGGPKPLKVRAWPCAGCGSRLDRDYNAAVNIIVAAGLAVITPRFLAPKVGLSHILLSFRLSNCQPYGGSPFG